MNDQRRFRPRLPRHGYYKIAQEFPPIEKSGRKWHDRFGYSGDDLRADREQPRSDLEVQVFRAWTAMRLGIESIDPDQHVVMLGHVKMPNDPGAFRKGERLLVENVPRSPGRAGQWYLDRPSGELTYVPMPGEQPEKSVVVAPRVERLMVFEGDPAARRWVEHLQFRGLTLAHANWIMPRRGQTCGQSEVEPGRRCFGDRGAEPGDRRLRRAARGRYAMAFGAGCRDNLIENCELVDLGGGGIKIGHAGGAPGRLGHRERPGKDRLRTTPCGSA